MTFVDHFLALIDSILYVTYQVTNIQSFPTVLFGPVHTVRLKNIIRYLVRLIQT